MNPIDKLCRFILDTDYSCLPEDVVSQVKRCIIDWLGVAIGGSKEPCVKIGKEIINELGGEPQATLPVFGMKTSVTNCALVLGIMSHALDYDDTHAGTLIHPSAPILSALLPIAEWRGLSGRSFIEAYAIAYDVAIRAGLALGQSHYARGWHSTSTLGHLGSTAGVGKLLGLKESQIINALALASTQAGGFRHVFGSMGKPFHPGRAASDGIMAALLAEKGFTCSREALDGDKGFFSIFTGNAGMEKLVDGLGREFKVLENSFKAHASCLLTHPTIDALLRIRGEKGFHIEGIEEVFCRVSRFCLDAAGKREPRNGLEGKFSIYFCSALALIEGRAGEEQFSDSMVMRKDICELSRKVTAKVDQSMKETEAHVSIRMKDGYYLEAMVDTPKGDPKNPLTDQELREKFYSLVRPVLSEDKAKRIIEIVEKLDEEKDLKELVSNCY
jgi:2-methylcitrate dehydratase PrpD